MSPPPAARSSATHPLNHELTAFYGRYGFKTFLDPNHAESMYILMKDVRRTLRDNGVL